MTDAKIDKFQNYFGIALRQNVRKLNDMRKSCLASMYNVAGYHDSCPRSKESGCQYQLDKLNNTNLYKSNGELPIDVRKAILPVYNDLCKEEMLKKCLHGKTQNGNESSNGTIWNWIPKGAHVGLSTLCSGVYHAASHFNYGQKDFDNIRQKALDTIRLLDIDLGIYMTKCCGNINIKRKQQSIYKTLSPKKKRRKILRHSSKKCNDNVAGPLMKQGFFKTFVLCLNYYLYIVGTPHLPY